MKAMALLGRLRRWIDASLQRRLVILVTVFWVASTLLISLIIILTSQQRMTRETDQRNTQLASVVSRDVNVQTGSVVADARMFEHYLETMSSDVGSQAEAVLALRLAAPQRYRSAYYFDGQGNLLFYLNDPSDSLVSLSRAAQIILSRPPIQVPADVSNAYESANSGTSLSDVTFSGIERVPVMYLGLPVDHAEEKSVLVLELDLSDIWQKLGLVTVGQSGFAYMVSHTGSIIAHPNEAYIGHMMPSQLASLISGNEGSTQYLDPLTKTGVLAAYSPVGGQTGWGVVIQQDLSEVHGSVRFTVFLSIGILAILGAIGTTGMTIYLRNVARPVVDLTKTAQSIALTGELTTTGMAQKPDEVGQLSQAFDQMIARLRAAQESLRQAQSEMEGRVVERTAELNQSNVELKNQIEQRELVEQALRQSELRYRHLVQSTNTIILEMDTEGRVAFLNRFAEEFFGFAEEELVGKSVVGTIVAARDSAGKDLTAMIEDIVHSPERYRDNENENIRRNGDTVWVMWSNQPLYGEDGHLEKILCVGIDMTEKKKVESVVAAQAREKAAVAERTRLARDLHDAVSQTLFSASLISEVLPKLWVKDQEQGRERLEEVRQLARGALAEMRTLLFELRPAALADADLGDLLRQLGDSVTGRARVPVCVNIEGDGPLPADTKVALYRIAQEALNNVAKHSAATEARVTMRWDHDRLHVCVADDGKGFDIARVRHGSLGLGIMQERARAIGAELNIVSSSDGTEVTIMWPANSKEKEQ